MVGGDEQARLPRRPPPQRWWMVILKIVSLSLLLFPSSTGGKFDVKPETRPLPSALAPEGERGGGEGEGGLDCRPRDERRGTVRRGSMYASCSACYVA